MSLGGPNGAERIFGSFVTSNYFTRRSAWFPRPDGCSFRRRIKLPGDSPIVVLSHGLWTRRFNQDPRVVGQSIRISGHPFTIVGVAPEGFQGTSVLYADLWLPLGMATITHVLPLRRRPAMEAPIKPDPAAPGRANDGRTPETRRHGRRRPPPNSTALGRTLAADDPGLKGSSLKVIASSPIPGKILAGRPLPRDPDGHRLDRPGDRVRQSRGRAARARHRAAPRNRRAARDRRGTWTARASTADGDDAVVPARRSGGAAARARHDVGSRRITSGASDPDQCRARTRRAHRALHHRAVARSPRCSPA